MGRGSTFSFLGSALVPSFYHPAEDRGGKGALEQWHVVKVLNQNNDLQ